MFFFNLLSDWATMHVDVWGSDSPDSSLGSHNSLSFSSRWSLVAAHCCWSSSLWWQSSSAKINLSKKPQQQLNHHCKMLLVWASLPEAQTWGRTFEIHWMSCLKTGSVPLQEERKCRWKHFRMSHLKQNVNANTKRSYLWRSGFLHCVCQSSSCSLWISAVFGSTPSSCTLCCTVHGGRVLI